jgi:5-methylcytosine-specific restriction protein A
VNRKQFIEFNGATCKNWTWSWSFVSHRRRIVIFGEWDTNRVGAEALILDRRWETSGKGRRQPGFAQAVAHLSLVDQKGYQLVTFPMVYSAANEGHGDGPATIGDFTPVLSPKRMIRRGSQWYAARPDSAELRIPEELDPSTPLFEGAWRSIRINVYERNPVARAQCLAHYGCRCSACAFDFGKTYGPIGEGFIHVHHLTPVAQLKRTYAIDPIRDLRPVCANCHAMIHLRSRPLTIQQLRARLSRRRGKTGKSPTTGRRTSIAW